MRLAARGVCARGNPNEHALPQVSFEPLLMIFPRLGLLASALALSSCLAPTAPEPADFQLSEQALARKYPAMRQAGTVRLYARSIATTRDQWGRETHQATGGALLVKASTPPILAEAASISVTPGFSEVSGRSTVKKNDRLYLGQEESSTIRIDGGEIIPSGPVRVRRVAAASTAPAAATAPAVSAAAPAVEDAAPQAAPAPPTPPQEKPKTVAKARPKPRPQPRAAAPAASSTANTSEPARPAPATTQATPPPARPAAPAPAAAAPAPKPKPAPAPDPARVLNLMRDPSER